MGKMDLIQTCLNDRSLEANLSCFLCACLLRKPRSVPPARGGARPRGCFLRNSHVAFGKPPGQNPAGGGSARGHPKKEPRAEESRGKPSCPQRTTARKEPELGSESFYKTSCHHRGGSGSAGGVCRHAAVGTASSGFERRRAHAGADKLHRWETACPPSCPGSKRMAQEN